MDISITKDFIEQIVLLVIYLLISGAVGIFIGWVYKTSHRGLTYSQSIATTLVLLTVVTTFIVYFIGDSMARAIGLFGVFSIIRYRSAVKDMRDTAFVLFALGAGMSIGVGAFILGILGVIVIGVIIAVLDILDMFSISKADYLLMFKMDSSKNSTDKVTNILKKLAKDVSLLSVKSIDNGSIMDFSFSLTLKKKYTIESVINKLNDVKGISDTKFVSSQKDIQF